MSERTTSLVNLGVVLTLDNYISSDVYVALEILISGGWVGDEWEASREMGDVFIYLSL